MEETKRLILDEKENNVIPLKPALITGGGKTGIWLRDLEIGTVFLFRPVQFAGWSVKEAQVVVHTKWHTQLYNATNQEIFEWVNTARFSSAFDLQEVLGVNRPNLTEQVECENPPKESGESSENSTEK